MGRLRASVRLLTLLALGLALLNPELFGNQRPRRRIHLVDVSASTRGGSFTSRDALQLALYDLQSLPGSLLTFAAQPEIHSRLEPSFHQPDDATDLAAAIERALWEEADDVLLYSDGRATRGNLDQALFHARTRGVPVHVIATGFEEPRDVRIVDIHAPASAGPADEYSVVVTVESTFDTGVTLTFGTASTQLHLPANVPLTHRFPASGPLTETVTLALQDDVPENNSALVQIPPNENRPRVLILSTRSNPAAAAILADRFAVEVRQTYHTPFADSLLVLEDFPAHLLSRDHMNEIHRYVTDGAGSLLMLGGPASLGPGGYADTPIETLLPLWCYPDESATVLFAIDKSGSMAQPVRETGQRRFDAALSAVVRSIETLRDRDYAVLLPFSGSVETVVQAPARELRVEALRTLTPSGPTRLAPVLAEAARFSGAQATARRTLIVVTDGELDLAEEPAEQLRTQCEALARTGIAVTCVATGSEEAVRTLESLKAGPVIPAADFDRLAGILARIVSESKEPFVDTPEPITAATASPLSEGLLPLPAPGRLNRTTRKEGSELLLLSGEHPVLAMGRAGQGRAAAATFGFSGAWPGALAASSRISTLVLRLARELAGPGTEGRNLSVTREGPIIHIRCTSRGSPPETFEWVAHPSQQHGSLPAVPTGRNEVGADLPFDGAGVLYVHAGGARASLHLSHAQEFSRIGIDAERLRSIADSTGGSVLTAATDLTNLPRFSKSGPRPSRPFWITLTLTLFMSDLLLGFIPPLRRRLPKKPSSLPAPKIY